MIVLRCTSRLLKRMRQPVKLPEPPAPTNPLGEWYADIAFINREPFVVLLNATTGAAMVLPGRAEFLKQLHVHAGQQFFKLLMHYGFDPGWPHCTQELLAWETAPILANTRDRSLLGSMNRLKLESFDHFAFKNRSLPEAAASWWEGMFRHPTLPDYDKKYTWHRPVELVAQRLAPPGTVMLGFGSAVLDLQVAANDDV